MAKERKPLLGSLSKAELIKLVQKLQKQVAKLEHDNVLRAGAQRGPPKPDAQFIADVAADQEPEYVVTPPDGMFPWEKK